MEKIQWRMFCNDRVNCCTRSAQGHLHQIWGDSVPSDQEILEAYGAISGYPDRDRGATMLDALNHWRKFGIGGRKIFAYLKIHASDRTQVAFGIQNFGGVYAGCQLPRASLKKDIWTSSSSSIVQNDFVPGSWGGHALTAVEFSGSGLKVVSWGRTFLVSWQWWLDYVDEAYVIADQEDKLRSRHLQTGRLIAALSMVASPVQGKSDTA